MGWLILFKVVCATISLTYAMLLSIKWSRGYGVWLWEFGLLASSIVGLLWGYGVFD